MLPTLVLLCALGHGMLATPNASCSWPSIRLEDGGEPFYRHGCMGDWRKKPGASSYYQLVRKKYPNICCCCSHEVDADAGLMLYQLHATGLWVIRHKQSEQFLMQQVGFHGQLSNNRALWDVLQSDDFSYNAQPSIYLNCIAPTKYPTPLPTVIPTENPTAQPTTSPTLAPTATPSVNPYIDNRIEKVLANETGPVCKYISVQETNSLPAIAFQYLKQTNAFGVYVLDGRTVSSNRSAPIYVKQRKPPPFGADPYCIAGIPLAANKSAICCAQSCSTCCISGCEKSCTYKTVAASDRLCSSYAAPCIMNSENLEHRYPFMYLFLYHTLANTHVWAITPGKNGPSRKPAVISHTTGTFLRPQLLTPSMDWCRRSGSCFAGLKLLCTTHAPKHFVSPLPCTWVVHMPHHLATEYTRL
jgi:hypothetical protein